jgi:hypothetical protein
MYINILIKKKCHELVYNMANIHGYQGSYFMLNN